MTNQDNENIDPGLAERILETFNPEQAIQQRIPHAILSQTSGTDYDADTLTTLTTSGSSAPFTTTWDQATRISQDEPVEQFQIAREPDFRCPTHGDLQSFEIWSLLDKTYCIRCMQDMFQRGGCGPLQTAEESERQGDFEL